MSRTPVDLSLYDDLKLHPRARRVGRDPASRSPPVEASFSLRLRRAFARWAASIRLAEVAGREARAARRSGLSFAERTARDVHILSRLAKATCDLHGLDISVHGEIPTSVSAVVANHVSYFDPLIVASRLCCLPIAKHELSRWPLIGRTARDLGTLFVRRHDTMHRAITLRRALRRLEAGITVLNFPEGTTSMGDGLLPLRRGIFGAAKLARVPIVPVWIEYHPRWLAWVGSRSFLTHYLRASLHSEVSVTLCVGAPIDTVRCLGATHLAQEASDALLELSRTRSHGSPTPRLVGATSTVVPG